jgi:hypothetical protein
MNPPSTRRALSALLTARDRASRAAGRYPEDLSEPIYMSASEANPGANPQNFAAVHTASCRGVRVHP